MRRKKFAASRSESVVAGIVSAQDLLEKQKQQSIEQQKKLDRRLTIDIFEKNAPNASVTAAEATKKAKKAVSQIRTRIKSPPEAEPVAEQDTGWTTTPWPAPATTPPTWQEEVQ